MHDQRAETEYDQEAERGLLGRLLERLDNKIVVDVGAEHGMFVRSFVEAGAEAVYAFEPYPQNVKALKTAFGEHPAVQIFDVAIGERDERVPLHVVEDTSGCHADGFHSLIEFEETPALRIVGKIPVECRTLASLIEEGAIPSRVGILKVDAERSDLAVLRGMGPLRSAVIMVEYWDDLPATVGPAAYQLGDVVRLLAKRGYAHFVVVKRHDQFETLSINDSATRSGDWGNVVFVHDTVFPQLASIVYGEVAAAQQRLLETAQAFADEAARRRETVEEIDATRSGTTGMAERDVALALREAELIARNVDGVADARLGLLEEQELALESYLQLSADGTLWRWVAPQLGVLYQHDPAPFRVPEHYLPVGSLPAPPLISIVTPTMNSAQFLMDTVESVIEQGYPNLEYIIQDGDSTDSTLTIVAGYGSRITRVASAPDTGMSQAINRGFRHATGEILAYLNSDDLLLPGSLQYVASYFAAHPDVDVVYGHRVIINMHNEEIGRWVLPPHDSDVLSWADYVPQETMFWRRRIWNEIGAAMDESFRFACDWDLLLRFREAGAKFTRLPRFLGAFRVHEEQKTSVQLAGIGATEMNRLRERYLGRPVAAEEIWHVIQPYLHRHKVYHKLYRLGVLRY